MPTATANPATCQGDCNGDGRVAINELVLGVVIALRNEDARVSACPSFDSNGDSRIAINELIAGVNNALDGCPD